MGVEDIAALSDILDPSGRGTCSQQAIVDLDSILNGSKLPAIHVESTFEDLLSTNDDDEKVPVALFMPVCMELYITMHVVSSLHFFRIGNF